MFRLRPSEDDPRICFCMKVHRQTLLAAIRAGAHSLAALQAQTRAGTGCGTCRIDLLQLLAEYGHGEHDRGRR
ncbi:MAG: (2Fe-2S)-binding protein [Planctomycetota bacterium]